MLQQADEVINRSLIYPKLHVDDKILQLLNHSSTLFFNFQKLTHLFGYQKDVSVLICDSFESLRKFSRNDLLPDWVIGCNRENKIFVLNPQIWKKINITSFEKVIIHEMTHVVINEVTCDCPIWLNEGFALWYADQIQEFKLDNIKFSNPYNLDYSKNIYAQSAFVIKKLFEFYPETYLLKVLLNSTEWENNKVFGLKALEKLFFTKDQNI